MKMCSGCKLSKARDQFHKSALTKDGIQTYCKECHSKHRKDWRNKNRERHRKHEREYRKSRPEKLKDIWLKRAYGISIEQYSFLFKEQNGCCAICVVAQPELKQALAVDHDHVTGAVRGLLCGSCNRALGMFKDNKESLKRAVDYLSADQSNVTSIEVKK